MQVTFSKLALPKMGALVLGVLDRQKLLGAGVELDQKLDGLLVTAMKASRFTGKAHQTLVVFSHQGRIVLYGLGDGSDINEKWCEDAGGKVAALLSNSGEKTVSVMFEHHKGSGEGIDLRAAHFGYGALLRAYRFDKYKTKMKADQKPTLATVKILVDGYSKSKKKFSELEAVAKGIFLARDLVAEPPNVLFPASFAKILEKLKQDGIKVEVLDEKEMSKLGMGALLGVGQGSSRESKLVVMRWNGGKRGEKPIAFVGKGVCFDTGGISLKPASGMEDMKWDMGGSGVVIGLMKALAGRKARVNAVGVVGLVENMPGGNAQRPGDVVTSMSGQTIEVLNTDAEGRLVLADALHFTNERFKPKLMVNLATLTGAIIVSLGSHHAGLFSNNDLLSERLTKAGEEVEERLWRLPLSDAYDKMINSQIADMQNIGGRGAGSITAAQFLQRFVGKTHWAHLDIAGVTWSKSDQPTVPKGGTAFGVRLLDRFVSNNYEN